MKVRKLRRRGAWLIVLLFIWPASAFAQRVLDSSHSRKLAPVLQKARPQNSRQSYRVQVTDEKQFINWLRRELPALTIQNRSPTTRTLILAGVTSVDLTKLLLCPALKYVDVADRVPQEELILERADLTANKVTAVHGQYPQLNGAGLVASIKESSFDTTDIDLKNRILRSPALAKAATTHATTMATLLAGGGNSAPSGKGVAPNAKLASSDFSNLLPDEISGLLALGVSVQNHSYGVTPENYYGLEAQAYDKQCRENPQLVHIFSAGNAGTAAITTGPYANLSGWANLTGQFKVAKNTLSVGATDTSGQLSPISSRGPAYDGRIKPELVAFGEGGTSESAALVSGMALLVQQAYQDQTGNLPPAALVKAALINSANKLGTKEVSFASGFGQADALGAIQAIEEKQFFNGTVSSGGVTTFSVPVPANTQLLKITLVWHDPEGEPEATKALVNDLDMILGQPATGKRWLPWVLSTYPHPDSLQLPARRAADHLNNVEQITLTLPVSGRYEVQVKGYQVSKGPQAFSLVYEVQPAKLTWHYPGGGNGLPAGNKNRIRWENQTNNTTGKLEYRILPAGNWQLVKEPVDLAKNFFDWQTPDTIALAQLRLTTGDQVAWSDTFGLFRPLPLQIGFNCGDEAMLFWPQQAGVTEYQVWQLGAVYLEPFVRTADTVVVLPKSQSSAIHYAVSPVWAGVPGPKSYTLDYTQGDCYVKSFLPQQLVTDTVTLAVELSTVYGLQAVSLERLENGFYQTIQTISPVKQLNFTFSDPLPQPGRNEYRVRVVNQAQQLFYSQTEGVVFTQPGFIQLFPNPVTRGGDLNIVVESDAEARIEVFNQVGRKVNEWNELGVIKTIPTANLVPGVYLVRVQNAGYPLVMARLVVL